MIENEQLYRASAYALLAALLRAAPQQPVLDHVASLAPEGDHDSDTLTQSMAALAAAAGEAEPSVLEDEYHELFIGLGRGEVVPYGSWYLTGFLMEQPLSDLRDDLSRLGFVRSEDVAEPEDHVAALFEVFSVMISEDFDPSEQQSFYQTHMLPWIGRFFVDLGKAKTANFYQAVAQFGAAFNELEKQYLSMRS